MMIDKEGKIGNLQLEYDELTLEFEKMTKLLEPTFRKCSLAEVEFKKIDSEVNYVNEDINKKIIDSEITQKKYIKTNKKKILLRNLVFSTVSMLFMTVILGIMNPYLLSHLRVFIAYLVGMPSVGAMVGIFTYILYDDRYTAKLQKNYRRSYEYLKYQEAINEKYEEQKQLMKKWNDKLSKYKKEHYNYRNIRNEIKVIEAKLEDLKRRTSTVLIENMDSMDLWEHTYNEMINGPELRSVPLVRERILDSKK